MKHNQLQVGMEVVVSTAPDTQIYKVESIQGFDVELSYVSCGRTSRSTVDVSIVRKPTQLQRRNAQA